MSTKGAEAGSSNDEDGNVQVVAEPEDGGSTVATAAAVALPEVVLTTPGLSSDSPNPPALDDLVAANANNGGDNANDDENVDDLGISNLEDTQRLRPTDLEAIEVTLNPNLAVNTGRNRRESMHYPQPPNYQAAVSEAVQREMEAMQSNLVQLVANAVAEVMRTPAQEELRSIQAWQKQQQVSLKRLPESTTLLNTHSHSDTTENSGKVDSPSDGKERANIREY